MVAESDDAFRRRFVALSKDRRAAFVADLFAAQGWTVEVNRSVVTATDGSRTQSIAVGAPPDERVDVVVQIEADRDCKTDQSGTSDASDADPETLAVEDLRSQLLYAVPRSTAEELAVRHFESELSTSWDPNGDDDDDGYSPAISRLSSFALVTGVAIGAVLVCLLVLGTPVADIEPPAPFEQSGSSSDHADDPMDDSMDRTVSSEDTPDDVPISGTATEGYGDRPPNGTG